MTHLSNTLSILNEDPLDRLPSDGATGDKQPPVARFDDPVWQLGFSDGRVGSPKKTFEDLVQHLGTTAKESVNTPASQAQDSTPAALEAAHAARITESRRAIELKHVKAPHLTSAWVATIEIVFGFLLLAGDLGLNWTVLGEAFKLTKDGEEAMRWFLCAGLVAVAGIAMPFFEEWVFLPNSHSGRKISTGLLLLLMVVMSVTVNAVRTDKMRADSIINQALERLAAGKTAPAPTVPQPTGMSAAEISYAVMSMAFALFSGFFLASGVHRLSERSKYQSLKDASPAPLPREPEKGEGALNLPTRFVDFSAKDRIHAMWFVYLHGYERGSAVRWTLREGESVYSHCLRVVRHRSTPTNYEQNPPAPIT